MVPRSHPRGSVISYQVPLGPPVSPHSARLMAYAKLLHDGCWMHNQPNSRDYRSQKFGGDRAVHTRSRSGTACARSGCKTQAKSNRTRIKVANPTVPSHTKVAN